MTRFVTAEELDPAETPADKVVAYADEPTIQTLVPHYTKLSDLQTKKAFHEAELVTINEQIALFEVEE